MVSAIQSTSDNILLRSLRPADYAALAPHLVRVVVQPRELISGQGRPIQFVDFPESAVVAACDAQDNIVACMTALVGCEGFVGWPALMGCSLSSHELRNGRERASMLRIDLGDLLAVIKRRPMVNTHLLRFVQALMVQMSATIVSSKVDPVERRVARLILMHHDRIEGDDFSITHQDMADMLAVRRASVTDALHRMEGERLIVSSRNRVVMRDRAGLQQCAGLSYGRPEAHYRRTIHPAERWKIPPPQGRALALI